MTDLRTEFTPAQYMCIHLANAMGHDKKTFEDRIAWSRHFLKANGTNPDKDTMDLIMENADSPYQFLQTLREIQKVMDGEETGLMVDLDATASFLQIMSCLSGCEGSATACNLVDPATRVDAYGILTDVISEAMPHLDFTRQQGKDLMMKSLAYGSAAVPKQLFSNESDYETYMTLMDKHFPGVMAVRNELLSLWNPNALFHTFTLPDGHVSNVPVKKRIEGDEARIEVAEVAPYNDGRAKSVTYIHEQHAATQYAVPILANTIQAIDGYLVRTVRERLAAEGRELVTIHDCFRVHPNDAGALRYHYTEALAEMAESNLLGDMIRDYTGEEVEIEMMSEGLATKIRNSRYALS